MSPAPSNPISQEGHALKVISRSPLDLRGYRSLEVTRHAYEQAPVRRVANSDPTNSSARIPSGSITRTPSPASRDEAAVTSSHAQHLAHVPRERCAVERDEHQTGFGARHHEIRRGIAKCDASRDEHSFQRISSIA